LAIALAAASPSAVAQSGDSAARGMSQRSSSSHCWTYRPLRDTSSVSLFSLSRTM
jgi:hypothetical protein